MKKSMSIVLSVIFLFLSLQSMAIAEEVSQQEETEVKQQETANEYAKYIEFVKKLDIMPEQAFEGKLYMTRGEFADYVNNILFSGNSAAEAQTWIAEVFKEDNVDELILNSTITDSFSDVSQSHAYYNEIEKVKQFLVMTGTGNGTFSPDEIITFGEVGIAMVRLLGYGIQAQRTSYEATAFKLGIFNGLSYNQNQNITKNELAKVFYNCADVELMEADIKADRIEYSVSEENMLEKFLDVYKDKGQVITNSFTSIYGTDSLGKNKVLINNVIFNIDNAEYLNDYIGREVEYYYFDDGEVELPQIMIAETTNKDEAVCIPAKDIVEFRNYRFVYEKRAKNCDKNCKAWRCAYL